MDKQTSELLGTLQSAIDIEDNGLTSYLKFARKTKNETGKNMFIRLALDEFEHHLILEKQLMSMLNWRTSGNIEIPESRLVSIAPVVREKQIRTKGEAQLAEIDALNTAADMERKSGDFYRERSGKADNQDVITLFKNLAEWEDIHLNLIQAELDAINQTGHWFGIPEFYMDGKY